MNPELVVNIGEHSYHLTGTRCYIYTKDLPSLLSNSEGNTYVTTIS